MVGGPCACSLTVQQWGVSSARCRGLMLLIVLLASDCYTPSAPRSTQPAANGPAVSPPPAAWDVSASQPPPGLIQEQRGQWWVAHNREMRRRAENAKEIKQAKLRDFQAQMKALEFQQQEQDGRRRQQSGEALCRVPALAYKSPKAVDAALGTPVSVRAVVDDPPLMPGENRKYRLSGQEHLLDVRFFRGQAVAFIFQPTGVTSHEAAAADRKSVV